MEVESDDDPPGEKIGHLGNSRDDDEVAGNNLSLYMNI